MINVTEQSKIYVMCPAQAATGGPELLHQLVYKLNKLGYDAYMYYFFSKDVDKASNPIHPFYEQYENPYVITLEDNLNNIIIFPEVTTDRIFDFKASTKVIWWLSVDFFVILWKSKNKLRHRIKKKIGVLKRYDFEKMPNLYHLVQSYYAEDFLSTKGVTENVGYLSDYLNKEFLENIPQDLSSDTRENSVLYNPKKGIEKVNKLKKMAPEINWIPIENMTPAEVVALQQKSKVYIDFGFHPGKDRIPREAAINGCCVIVGKEGAANFYKDIPISDNYKFEFTLENHEKIIDKIKDCFTNYKVRILDFENYRNMILAEEYRFEKDILNNFKKV